MKSELVDKALEVVQDPQMLVNIVSRRVAQLNNGKAPLVGGDASYGLADIALLEIIEGKVDWKAVDETAPVK